MSRLPIRVPATVSRALTVTSCATALLAAAASCSSPDEAPYEAPYEARDEARGDAHAGPAPESALRTYRFDDPSTQLDGWVAGTTNAEGTTENAEWMVRADDTAPSRGGSVALVDPRGHVGQHFNLFWNTAPLLADVDVTVAVRRDGGVEDQGGGPAWRITGPNDYYAARWNPLEDNFRVYSIQGGQRLQLDSARVRVDPEQWHTIRVRQVGAAITCWFDGEELLHATDAELAGPGAVGLWTKADATTRFDDLVVAAADASR